jgi:hypothetical protein
LIGLIADAVELVDGADVALVVAAVAVTGAVVAAGGVTPAGVAATADALDVVDVVAAVVTGPPATSNVNLRAAFRPPPQRTLAPDARSRTSRSDPSA